MSIQLDQSAIYAELNSLTKQYIRDKNSIEVFQKLDSTQLYLREKLRRDSLSCSDTALVVTESQSSGMGRMNREWKASAKNNILLSCCWVYDSVPKDLAGLSLALIVSLAEYLKDNYGLPISIKWPNDLLLGGKKVAGLLVDVETGQECRIVIGLGLNVEQSFEDGFIDQSWADLSQFGILDVDRNKMIADIFSTWVKLFVNYPMSGFSGFQDRWNNLSEHKGKEIVLKKSSQGSISNIQGVMEGVDKNGFLLVRSFDGIQAISDASYSLKVL